MMAEYCSQERVISIQTDTLCIRMTNWKYRTQLARRFHELTSMHHWVKLESKFFLGR